LFAGVVTKFSNKTGRAYSLDTAVVISVQTRSSCDHVTLNKPPRTPSVTEILLSVLVMSAGELRGGRRVLGCR
jgi:hypothetical protein